MLQTAAQARPLGDTAEWRQLHCSFCGKDAEYVRFLTSGVFGVMICDRCCLRAAMIFLKAHLAAALRMAAS